MGVLKAEHEANPVTLPQASLLYNELVFGQSRSTKPACSKPSHIWMMFPTICWRKKRFRSSKPTDPEGFQSLPSLFTSSTSSAGNYYPPPTHFWITFHCLQPQIFADKYAEFFIKKVGMIKQRFLLITEWQLLFFGEWDDGCFKLNLKTVLGVSIGPQVFMDTAQGMKLACCSLHEYLSAFGNAGCHSKQNPQMPTTVYDNLWKCRLATWRHWFWGKTR